MSDTSYKLVSDVWKVEVCKKNDHFPLGKRVYCFSIECGNQKLVIATDYNNRWAILTPDTPRDIFKYIYNSPLWSYRRIAFLEMFNRKNANILNENLKIKIEFEKKKSVKKVG